MATVTTAKTEPAHAPAAAAHAPAAKTDAPAAPAKKDAATTAAPMDLASVMQRLLLGVVEWASLPLSGEIAPISSDDTAVLKEAVDAQADTPPARK